MTVSEELRHEAKGIRERAIAFEKGELWVGATLVPTQPERDEAANMMRRQADELLKLADKLEGY